MKPFRIALLETSRVVFSPACPAPTEWRITIRCDSRAALGREVLSVIAFRGDIEANERAWWLAALEDWTALAVRRHGGHRLPRELSDRPRPEKIQRALNPGLARFKRAIEVAHRLVDHVGDPRQVARALVAGRAPGPKGHRPKFPSDAYGREVVPYLPLAHLALPIAARWRQPETFQRRSPKLVPWALPLSFGELLADDAWPLVLLDAAEQWRRLLPFPVIEVRGESP